MTKILITGIGITGKSTFRAWLAKIFSDAGFDAKEFDADYDYGKIPNIFSGSATYVIEDVHATTNEAIATLDSYDFIFYVQTDIYTHILFWLSRMIAWFQNGQYSWDQKDGWLGTDRRYDLRNVIPILKGFFRDFRNRKKWVSDDLRKISASKVPFRIVQSQWKFRKKIKFCATFRFKR